MNSGTSPKLKFFNTATKTKEDFVPLNAQNVRIYVCGPTVYDYAHIGNARPAIVFDVLYRLLRHVYGPDHVTYVRNITDVDDKINARAVRDFPDLALNQAIGKLTKKTEIQYQNDMKALGCLEPTLEPRATNHIAEMIEMIKTLLDKGNAYVADGHVLFDVKSFKNGGEIQYGKLARRTLDDMIAGARVEVAPYKRDAMDFVMWKPSAGNEPGWDSPWGVGRPGWHIECSAMSRKYLGEVFDIHGGGIDLSFPHHENELAQSCCANGKDKMAQIWMHNGFLQVEGEKMSKSLGNFFTVDELLNEKLPSLIPTEIDDETRSIKRDWNGLCARLSMLQSKYREPIDWTRRRFLQSGDELIGWYELLRGIHFDASPRTVAIDELVDIISDDLNTSKAITYLRYAAKNNLHRQLGEGMHFLGLLNQRFLENDGILLFDRMPEVSDAEIDQQITTRLEALADKDFATADNIRADLLEQGIQLMDYKDPETGERRTKWEVKR